ncbi:MAG: sigma-70 family RNA polymerase sigma factor [Asticcacaulis sp.]
MNDSGLKLTAYLRHRKALIDYATPITGDRGQAEDVVQEAWVRFAYRDAGTPDRLSPVEQPLSYLYRIVRNLAHDSLRRRKREGRYMDFSDPQAAEDAPLDRPSAETEIIDREDLERVMAAMAELPERTRIALEMHRFGGCKLKDIADHFGISISRAQVLVMDGVKHCQRSL